MAPSLALWPKGLPIYLPLSVLLLQTTMPLLIRLSRRTKPEEGGGVHYNAAVVTFAAELVKSAVAILFLIRISQQHNGSQIQKATVGSTDRFTKAMWRLRPLIIPSMLYFASNVMSVHALSRLRSYVFTAIMNSRIVFAALLSMVLLNKAISPEQWRAVIVIFCAATILCLEDVQVNQNNTFSEETVGIFIGLATAAVSATGGVFIEKYLTSSSSSAAAPASVGAKGAGQGASVETSGPISSVSNPDQEQAITSLWEQQGVLAVFSAIFAGLYVLIFSFQDIQQGILFQGWTHVVVLIMFMQALQGILVAMTIQKCGIVFRLILGTISICLCILIEGVIFLEPVVFRELLAITLVITGSNLYTIAKPASRSSPSKTSHREKSGSPKGSCKSSDVSGAGKCMDEEETDGGSAIGSKKADGNPFSSSFFSSFSLPLQSSKAVSGVTLRRVTLMLLIALVYISASSSYSMILASKARLDNKALLEETQTESFLKHPKYRALASAGGKENEEMLTDENEVLLPLKTSLRRQNYAEFKGMLAESDNSLMKAAAVALEKREDESGCQLETFKEKHPWNRRMTKGKKDIGICMQMKNDAKILDEYIAFHWIQGVSKFVIFDDGSEDDPWSVLEKYVALGIVEYHNLTGHPEAGSFEFQIRNVNDCFKDLRARSQEEGLRWLLFPDVDEFVMSQTPKETLSQALNARYDGAPCLEVARTYYGSSFIHKRPQKGLVIENYLLSSPDGADGFPKMIANINPTNAKRNATALYSIHNIVDQADLPCRWKAETGGDIRINHYVRSLEDYETKVMTGHKVVNRYAKPLQIWWERDRNDELQPVASTYACQVHAALAQIQEMQDDGRIPSIQRPLSCEQQQRQRPQEVGTDDKKDEQKSDANPSSLAGVMLL